MAVRTDPPSTELRPVPVRLNRTRDGWELLRDGAPYFIKGAGGWSSLGLLAECGGNSLRTWATDDAERILDEAHRHGLTVTVGIWLGHKEQGFRYTDASAVEAQFEMAKAAILRFRNHPALLAWGIGNEMEGYDGGDDPLVWGEVERIARFAKENDPNHPTMTIIAEIGGQKLQCLDRYCRSIDIVGINSYGGAATVGERYSQVGIDKPYVLTEFGPRGWWENDHTEWGAPIERTSTEKAREYREAYLGAVERQPGRCLGSYAFLWGEKHEATATWFGMLLPDGSKVGAVDVVSERWTGVPPAYPCPKIDGFWFAGPVVVAPGAHLACDLKAVDPMGDVLTAEWILVEEASERGVGGAYEPTPRSRPEATLTSSVSGATFRAPSEPGGYRVFITVRNSRGGAATANVPFLVRTSD